jgi:hypothetical protein
MRPPTITLVLLAGFSTLACAHTHATPTSTPPVPEDPCRGVEIQLEEVTSACVAADTGMPAPPAGALETTFAPSAVLVTSEQAATVRGELRNTTGEPLEVFLSPLAGYVTAIMNGDQRVDQQWLEERMGGISGTVRPWRVVLEPDGVISADFEVSARVTTLGYELIEEGAPGYRIVTGDGGAIPPGDYTLQVFPPLSGEHHISFLGGYGKRPMVELPLCITP